MARGKKAASHRRRGKRAHSNFATALQRLKKLKAAEQKQAMRMANNTFIRQFCKQLKTLKHAKLTAKSKKALRRHRKQLRQLVSSRTGMSKRRRMLSQGGGGLLKTILRYVPVIGPFVDLIDRS